MIDLELDILNSILEKCKYSWMMKRTKYEKKEFIYRIISEEKIRVYRSVETEKKVKRIIRWLQAKFPGFSFEYEHTHYEGDEHWIFSSEEWYRTDEAEKIRERMHRMVFEKKPSSMPYIHWMYR
jgi:hypothetical protein